jgi:hypothetical protein
MPKFSFYFVAIFIEKLLQAQHSWCSMYSKVLIIWANERKRDTNNQKSKDDDKVFCLVHSQSVKNYFTFCYTTDSYFEKYL